MLQVFIVLMSHYIRDVAVFQDCRGPTFDFSRARHLFYRNFI